MTWKVLLPRPFTPKAVLLIFVLLNAPQPRQRKLPEEVCRPHAGLHRAEGRGVGKDVLVDAFDGVADFTEASAGEITRFSIVI
jgi:hypothetical protein